MSYTVEEIQKKIRNLEAKLEEAQKRLPAHSVKPPIMHQIFALEEELEELYELLKLNKSG